jgi:hypothetical protein
VENSFEHGNEPLGTIKRWKILDWWIIKKDLAPLS